MRKVLFALFLLLGLSSINAQVKNYSLKFNPQGFVTLGDLPALNNLSSFTIQFWMCPTEWQKGTTLLNRGDSFSIALGNEGQLTVAIGASEVTVSSPRLTSQVWNHITILNGDGQFAVRINNEEVYTYSNSYIIPNEEVHCILGGNYSGRLDELRIWKTVLSSDYNYMWQNTLNQYHPQWNDLVAYYKFDQDLCENIVDYTYQNHGTMTTTGVIREVVADNDSFRYFIAGAYSDFSRFADRAIDREKYLLANTLIVLGINSNSDGRAYAAYPYNEGIVSNGSYLAEYQGRKGVLALNGSEIGRAHV